MATFPSDIPTFQDLVPGTLAENNHGARHNKVHHELEAVAIRVGATDSIDPTSHEKRITDLEASTGGATNSMYENEVPAGLVNGSNVDFTVDNSYVVGSLKVYKNGIRLKGGGNDFTEVSMGFTLTQAPVTGTLLLVDYMTATGVSDNADTLDGYHATALIAAAVAATKEALYPVGSIYTNASSTINPATLLGFGTWSAFGSGRVLVGLNSGDADFDTLEETGGAKTHTLITSEMPAHTHVQSTGDALFNLPAGTANVFESRFGYNTTNDYYSSANGRTSSSTGGGGAHNNLQPYIVVSMWKRTA